jgi:hypothetical protein
MYPSPLAAAPVSTVPLLSVKRSSTRSSLHVSVTTSSCSDDYRLWCSSPLHLAQSRNCVRCCFSSAKDLNAVFSSLMLMQLLSTLFALCTFAFDVSTVSILEGSQCELQTQLEGPLTTVHVVAAEAWQKRLWPLQ